MTLCKVIGTVVCPVQNPHLFGQKLLLCQPIELDGAATGDPFVAVDRVQAGIGDLVLTNKEGGGARIVLQDESTPVQQMVTAIVDDLHVDRSRPYDPPIAVLAATGSARP